jgi:hypothetical protein
MDKDEKRKMSKDVKQIYILPHSYLATYTVSVRSPEEYLAKETVYQD